MNVLADTQLFEVARNQKRILWLLLISVVVVFGTFCIPPNPVTGVLIFAALVFIGIIAAVFIYRLAKALEVEWTWLYVACSFIPYVNTATLLVINLRATA